MNRENLLKVAETSKKHAENYIAAGNFGRSFSHYLVALKLNPEWKDELKETFSAVLCRWGTSLEENGRYDDLFKCYERAVEVFPDNELILTNLGVHLLRCNLTKEAVCTFRKCLALVPCYFPAFWNLENALNLAVERWHFRMLNDEHRNDAFRESIMKKVRKGFNCVLDIGTGTGILSLMALEAKAEKIYACDSSDIMIDLATEVFKANNASDKIILLPKHSKYLKIGHDIPSKISLVVTETLDSGLLGEHVLQTLIHAWQHLLLPPTKTLTDSKNKGVLIPFGAVVYLAGIECEEISKKFYLRQNNLSDIKFPNTIQKDGNYDTENLKTVRFKYLTNVQRVLDINFNDPEMMIKILNGEYDCDLNLKIVKTGRLDCFAVWFDLRLDEDIVLNTGPDSKETTCWDQAIFPLSRNLNVKEGQDFKTRMSLLNGKIKIEGDDVSQIEDNLSNLLRENEIFSPSEDVIRMLNDRDLVGVLNECCKVKDRFKDPVKILDTFPFPVFGLNFLLRRMNSVDVLHCVVPTEEDKKFVEHIARENNIGNKVICALERDMDDVLNDLNGFDIILLNIVEATGELKRTVSSRLDFIRKSLKPNALLLPEEISIMGQLVESSWMERMSKVISDEVTCGYKIRNFINNYQVRHHIDFNLSAIDKTERSEQFEVINLNESKNSKITIKIIDPGATNALIYWFSLKFLSKSEVQTLYCSFFNQSAILFEKQEVIELVNLEIYFEEGLFHVEMKNL